jgi:biopolymer transport protein TolR
VLHPVSMPSANREDAMIVNVTRDGKIYFDTKQVRPADLAQKIADRLKDRSVERKVYIKADMRARWSSVKPVIDGVRAAGILRVALLTYQRPSGPFHL